MTTHALDETIEDLYDHAPCGYLSSTPDGTIVRVNATFLEWTGYAREDLVGVRRFQDLLTVGGRIYHETHIAPLLRMHGAVREISVELRGADGRRMPALLNAVLRRDAAGIPQGVRTTVFDASERQRYERELLAWRDRERSARERVERLQRLTAAIAAAPDAGAIAEAVVAGLREADPAAGVAVVVGAQALAEAGGGPWELHVPLDGPGDELLMRPGRPLTPEERAFVRACAEQARVALARARLYEQQRDVARTLQQSLIAGAPPADPRVEIATAYRPAVAHLEVGGDWHDAFALPDGRLALVVGDVMGRGLMAATAMGQLRSAVRALAAAGTRPGRLLDHLDTFVDQVPAAQYATVAYVELDPATGEAVAALAGHPPPVVVPGPGAAPTLFMGGRSTPLGVRPPEPREEARLRLAPLGILVLYTDGLVERRGETLDVGMARLMAAVAERPPSLDGLARSLPDTLGAHADAGDDVCVLVARRAA